MIPSVGDKIEVFDLPSYKAEAAPNLPVITEVIDVTEYPMVIVEIGSRKFELYEDEGYKAITVLP